MAIVPRTRIALANDRPERPDGAFILYWMTSARRTSWNFGLDRALELARARGLPLVVLEALRIGYPWACDRLHRFILDGMAANVERLRGTAILYHPYVEPTVDAGKGLLRALSRTAAVVVTDTFPCFMLPRMLASAARQLDVRLEAIDGNGLLPLTATASDYPTAYAFRRYLQRALPAHLECFPHPDPLARLDLPPAPSLLPEIAARWPAADLGRLRGPGGLSSLAIDHAVAPVRDLVGGSLAGEQRLERFVSSRLPRYGEDRNDVAQPVTSGLSPYLHFGHVSAHAVFAAIVQQERWSPDRLNLRAGGSRSGYWGVSAAAEGFLDQLITWRELGYNFCHHRADHDRYESLPEWARRTLDEHLADPRPWQYTLDQLERADTHDPIWNAAQTQLRREGIIHNYLRMLWGKKVLEWSASPAEAAATLLHLNNKYALDGRNPNSESGIFWCFGRYDRAWGPEREIFGKIRYMSSDNTARKLDLKPYLARYGPASLFD
ncbi:MAG: deoxyribodipyrimidine photolyase [Candidatus Eisenbacteria bacterium]|nr:deoxyribodipyrimidine photolyase [Candidatus Eisenbacteria bacterium]